MTGRGVVWEEDLDWAYANWFTRAWDESGGRAIWPKEALLKAPMGSLKTTRWLYPSHCLLDLSQLLHFGLPSSHLMRRLRQAFSAG